MKMNKSTSWGKVANWYDNFLEKNDDSYQRQLILPNLIRLLKIKREEVLLDLGCGQGFFSREFKRSGAKVIGVDISPELIEIAKKHRNGLIEYHVAAAHDLGFIRAESIDKIAIILTLQNIQNINDVIKECRRVLKPKEKLFIVLNHPAFRIPKKTSWGWDNEKKVQYRKIDEYLSESGEKIQMHPGIKPSEKTISFHRPLQFYFKILSNNGFCVSRLEEWNSHKTSEPGPKAEAENKARREIPLFLFLEAIKQ